MRRAPGSISSHLLLIHHAERANQTQAHEAQEALGAVAITRTCPLPDSLALVAVSDDGVPDGPDDVGEDEDAEVVEDDGLGVARAQPLGEGAVPTVAAADHYRPSF